MPRIKMSGSYVVLGAFIPNAILDQPHIYHVRVNMFSMFFDNL
jgi:hypothetical protein